MKGYELLDNPNKWTKWAFRRDVYGNDADHLEGPAVRWCAYGAMMECYPDAEKRGAAIAAVEKMLFLKVGLCSLIFWNDRYATFEDVRALFKEADV